MPTGLKRLICFGAVLVICGVIAASVTYAWSMFLSSLFRLGLKMWVRRFKIVGREGRFEDNDHVEAEEELCCSILTTSKPSSYESRQIQTLVRAAVELLG